MGKTDKLYKRLDELENEYADLLEQELEVLAKGRSSLYFSRKVRFLFDGKCWRDKDTAYIEKLEKDIYVLRQKLHEPISNSYTNLINQFMQGREIRKDWNDGGEKPIVLNMLKQLQVMRKLSSENK